MHATHCALKQARNSVENSHLLAISHDLSMQTYAATAIANVLLMGQCSHFVGGFGSHFGRLAYELGTHSEKSSSCAFMQ